MIRTPLILFASLLAIPQVPPPPSARPGAPAQRASLFQTLLERLDWNPAERGVLIVVAPDQVQPIPIPIPRPNGYPAELPTPVRTLQPNDIPTPNGAGYHLLTLEKYFERKVMKAGGVTVFAPRTMDVLNWQRLPKPSATAGLSRDAKLTLWEASLTAAQWKLYASPQGIGVGDLDRDQAALYTESLPENATILRRTPGSNGGIITQQSTPLTPTLVRQLRRTLSKQLSWNFMMSNGGSLSFGDDRPGAILATRGRFGPFNRKAAGVVFGVTVRDTLPNRSKPGAIAFDSAGLDRNVDLVGARSIADMVARVSRACGVPIMVDPRFGELKVTLRGASARAGDLLHALALSVTGTYRRLGDTYVLTDDLVPLGTRLAAIGEWVEANRSLTVALLADAAARRGDKANANSDWPDGPERPDASLLAKLAEAKKRLREPWTEADNADPARRRLVVPIEELPPGIREIVRQQGERTFGSDEGVTIRRDAVMPQERLTRGFFLPGFGPISDMGWKQLPGDDGTLPGYFRPALPDAPNAVPLPRSRHTAVQIHADSAETATRSVFAAARAGFDSVWISAKGDDSAVLTAAAGSSHEAGVAVYAVVRPVRDSAVTAHFDPTIRGETPSQWARRQQIPNREASLMDFSAANRVRQLEAILSWGDPLRIDRPEDRNRLTGRVAKVADIPGISGLVVAEWAPAAYLSAFESLGRMPELVTETGYAEEMRLRCLKEHGFDPADLGSPAPLNLYLMGIPFGVDDFGRQPDLGLPFFTAQWTGSLRDMASLWQDLRATVALESLNALRAGTFGKPVFYRFPSPFGQWFANMDRAAPTAPQRIGEVDYNTLRRREKARLDATSTQVVEMVGAYEDPFLNLPAEESLARWTNALAQSKEPLPDQRVYDLTPLSTKSQTWFLEHLALAPRPAGSPKR